MLYEFITPSDPITFHAADDGVAFCVATLLGNGEAVAIGDLQLDIY